MSKIRSVVNWVSYGAVAWAGKVLLVLFVIARPVWAGEGATLLALGDSLTQGYGLPQEAGFVPQLQEWLGAQGAGVTVINGGVSGDTTAGGAARVAWSLSDDVDAMIVALGGNDLLRGIDPAVSRGNLMEILRVANAREVPVLLIGLQAPGNYGPDYKTAFDAIYPELAAEFGALYATSFFQGLPGDTPGDVAAFMQADGIHPNAEGVVRIVKGLGPDVVTLLGRVN